MNQYLSDYNRERDRLRKQLARMAKRGYVFAQEIMPPRPKKITAASVRRLQRLITEVLYKKSIYVDPQTGEAIPGLQGRKLEAQHRAQKSAETKRKRAAAQRPTPESTEAPLQEYQGAIGTYDVLVEITNALQQLPRRNYFYGYLADTSGDRAAVLALWDQMMNPTLPEGVTMESYRRELAAKMESRSAEIKEMIAAMVYDSQSSMYYFHLRRLIELLTPGITLDAQTLRDIGDQMWEYEVENEPEEE